MTNVDLLVAEGLPEGARNLDAPITTVGVVVPHTHGDRERFVADDGTVTLTHIASGRTVTGLLDDADAGHVYGFGSLAGDSPVSSRSARTVVTADPTAHRIQVAISLNVPACLSDDRSARSRQMIGLPVTMDLVLAPGADSLDVVVTVENRARDHRMRLRFPFGVAGGTTLAETAFGTITRVSR